MSDVETVPGLPVEVPPHEFRIADQLLQARAAPADKPDEQARAELARLLVA